MLTWQKGPFDTFYRTRAVINRVIRAATVLPAVVCLQGTTSMNKLAPMNRSDGFTKLIGDPNKRTEDQ